MYTYEIFANYVSQVLKINFWLDKKTISFRWRNTYKDSVDSTNYESIRHIAFMLEYETSETKIPHFSFFFPKQKNQRWR